VYGGRVKLLVDALDARLARFAIERGAVSQNYPSTVSRESMVRSGYLRAFPHHAMFVAASTEDAAGLKAIADSAVGSVLSPGALGPHDQVLAPTVCYHCFEALGGAADHRHHSRARPRARSDDPCERAVPRTRGRDHPVRRRVVPWASGAASSLASPLCRARSRS
jgi:hypothetical protein